MADPNDHSGENGMPPTVTPSPTDEEKRVNLQRIRDQAQELQNDITYKLNLELKEMFDNFITEVEKIEQNGKSDNPWGETQHKKKYKPGELPDKVFIARRSVLSELFEISHIQSIFHIFVAIFILSIFNTVVYDIIDKGVFGLDCDMLQWAFGKFSYVIVMWLFMQGSTMLIVYPGFHHWMEARRPIRPYWYDYLWLAFFLVYQFAFIIIPIWYILHHQLPPASTLTIVAEQVRLVMKVHSFIRENSIRMINYQTRKKDETVEVGDIPSPGFSRYIYFLFAPTLIYRDTYPRTRRINWNYVFTNFAQVLACMFYTYYIFERFCYPVFRNFNHEHVTPKRLLLSVFNSMLPGTLVLLIAFFGMLHSWLNAFAEMLYFADRMFYRDWWNSTKYARFYRTWNGVVHDWLYSYVYKDVSLLLGPHFRLISLFCVFFISAVVHEYIIIMTLGFFYPVMFALFAGAGFPVMLVSNQAISRSWNIFMWGSLFMGNGLMMCLYSNEYYARHSCPAYDDTYLDYLIPRSWTCDFAAQNLTTH